MVPRPACRQKGYILCPNNVFSLPQIHLLQHTHANQFGLTHTESEILLSWDMQIEQVKFIYFFIFVGGFVVFFHDMVYRFCFQVFFSVCVQSICYMSFLGFFCSYFHGHSTFNKLDFYFVDFFSSLSSTSYHPSFTLSDLSHSLNIFYTLT